MDSSVTVSSETTMILSPPVGILHLFISPGHNFFGHHNEPAGTHPTLEVKEVECVAGKGLFEKIKKLTRNPHYICFNCGRVADSEKNVCNPMPLHER